MAIKARIQPLTQPNIQPPSAQAAMTAVRSAAGTQNTSFGFM
jgi:hypothetical protein